jgi:formate hydrogenlyase subunit 3/multisubunit Na+/H+ antiporter MnhD subunit
VSDREPTTLRGATIGALAVVATWLLPGFAAACSTCLGGDTEASRKAFIGTTAFMTFFPLLMLVGVIGWFIRRALRHEREEDARIHADPSGAPLATSDRDARGVVRPLF